MVSNGSLIHSKIPYYRLCVIIGVLGQRFPQMIIVRGDEHNR